MKRKIYRFQYDKKECGWILRHDRKGIPGMFFNVKRDGLKKISKFVKAQRPSQLMIHKMDGTFQTEYTYGSDPMRTVG